MNKLYFGDNLDILREHPPRRTDETVDLIYLDPPFNSKRDYSVLFKTPKGHESDAQITAFEDSWHWGEQAEREFSELEQSQHTDVAEMMIALRKFLDTNDMMAYLTMMANRLLELQVRNELNENTICTLARENFKLKEATMRSQRGLHLLVSLIFVGTLISLNGCQVFNTTTREIIYVRPTEASKRSYTLGKDTSVQVGDVMFQVQDMTVGPAWVATGDYDFNAGSQYGGSGHLPILTKGMVFPVVGFTGDGRSLVS